MPRVVVVAVESPVSVRDAATVLGSPVRIHLIRHFRQHPGPQRAAVEALGVGHNVVSSNTRALIEVGVIVEDPAADGRTRTYRVDETRLRAIIADTLRFALED